MLDNGISSFLSGFYCTQELYFNGVSIPNYEEIGSLKWICKCACHCDTSATEENEGINLNNTNNISPMF